MANRYDDETMKFIETRKRVAHMRREEAKRKRNIMIAIIAAVVLVVLIVVIAVASCGGCGSKKEEPTTVAPTTVAETTEEETTEEETTEAEDFAEGSKAYVNDDGVNLREEASTDSEVLDQLSKGTEVTVVANEGDWIKVKTDSKEGYISKDLLSTEKLSSSDSGSSDDSNSDDSSSDDDEREIVTRKRTISTTTKSSSSSSNKSKTDKRTLY